MSDFSNRWESRGVKNEIYELNNGHIELSKVIVPKEKRGQGIGSQFMEDLTNYADRNGKVIELTPDTSFGATSVSRLRDFYKGFGFVDNAGRNKDYSISNTMYRLPK
jgi:predicted GNAT family N-acyltransferase